MVRLLALLPQTVATAFLFISSSVTAAEAQPSTRTDADQAQSACLKFAKRLGSVHAQDCLGKDFRLSQHYSLKNEPILLRDFKPAGENSKARVLVIGGIHGDELTSVSIVFSWLRELERAGAGDYQWRLTPAMNPDGVLNRPSQRTNQRGVDLNRNFPTPNWHKEAEKYWVHRTRRNPRRYPGPDPLSEPESRWLYEEIARFQPHAIVAIHAPFGIVDFDGPSEPPNKLGKLHLNLLGTYVGSLGNYAGVQEGIPVVTVELPSAGIMPKKREQKRIWQDLLLWLNKHIPTPEQRAALETTPSPQ